MNPQDFNDLLLQTFEDHQLSRKEKQLLKEIVEDINADEQKLAQYRHQAFAVAQESLPGDHSRQILDWLEEVIKVLHRNSIADKPGMVAEAYFSPGDDCAQKIASLIGACRSRLDVCVFTITDNRIARAIEYAHGKGIQIRIITDNEKLHDPGSDILHLRQAGVPIRIDETEFHMHHKFALFDNQQLLTGSYNWTRGAAENNEENFLLTDDPRLYRRYAQMFEELWEKMKKLD